MELTLGITLAVLGAGFFHAGWNALLKSSPGGDSLLDTATVVAGSALWGLAVVPFVPLPAAAAWPYMATSAVIHFGYYLTLAGYTGYANFVHLKPSITLKPLKAVTAMLAVAAQWRETTADSTFIQPDISVPGTAGHGGGYTGSYIQGRVDWQISRQMSAAVEAVHFAVSDTIKSVGGHDGNYLGVETKVGW